MLKRVGIGALLLAILVALAGGAFFLKFEHNINKGKHYIPGLKEELNGAAINVLVLGSDNRSVIGGSAREERQFKGGSGQRADTILLIHISKNSDHAVVMSIPRDLWVEIPGHGHSKINAAYAYGGPELAIKTVTMLTGIPINHYVEVNFAGFLDIVNALGGVDIYVNRPLIDKKSGLDIKRPGCIHMDGNLALSFVRARYIDPTADLGRIQRQQLFIRTLMKKAHSVGVLLNPIKLDSLTSAVGRNVVYDNRVGFGLARSIANKLSASNNRVDFRIVPAHGAKVSGSSVLLADARAKALFAALKADAPLPPYGKTSQSIAVPGDVRVKVVNGSGINSLGTKMADRLRRAGFDVVQVRSGSKVARTRIEYIVGEDRKVQLVEKFFPGASIVVGGPDQVTDVIVTLGPDAVQATSSPSPGAPASPTPKRATGSSCG